MHSATIYKIFLACRSVWLQSGLKQKLSDIEEFDIVISANNISEAIEAIKIGETNILICSDASIEEVGELSNGVQAEFFTLIISSEPEFEEIQELLNQHIDGIVLHDSDMETVVLAIKIIGTGKKFLDPVLVDKLVRKNNLISLISLDKHELESKLSRRQLEVFKMLSEGYSNKQIAHKLNITERTVRYHLEGIYNKLGIESRNKAIAVAVQLQMGSQNQSN